MFFNYNSISRYLIISGFDVFGHPSQRWDLMGHCFSCCWVDGLLGILPTHLYLQSPISCQLRVQTWMSWYQKWTNSSVSQSPNVSNFRPIAGLAPDRSPGVKIWGLVFAVTPQSLHSTRHQCLAGSRWLQQAKRPPGRSSHMEVSINGSIPQNTWFIGL